MLPTKLGARSVLAATRARVETLTSPLHVGVSNPASCNASSHLLTAWKHGAGSRNAVNDHVCNNWVSILDHLYAVCPTRPERCDPGSHRLCQPKSSHRHKEIRSNLRGFWCLWCPQDGPRLHRNVLKTGGIALARQRATRNSLQLTRTSRTKATMLECPPPGGSA